MKQTGTFIVIYRGYGATGRRGTSFPTYRKWMKVSLTSDFLRAQENGRGKRHGDGICANFIQL